MRKELDEKLCSDYPKIFRDRHGDVRKTCMVWGFECGDGWYPLIDQACRLIQIHIDRSRLERYRALKFNRALSQALNGNMEPIRKFFSINGKFDSWSDKQVTESLNGNFRAVPKVCPQVIALQVKEKFGTLRFYTGGGDYYTDGIIQMTDAMSAVMCEVCGKPGKISGNGWLKCRCTDCLKNEQHGSEKL